VNFARGGVEFQGYIATTLRQNIILAGGKLDDTFKEAPGSKRKSAEELSAAGDEI
jgi:hypothetical protein